MTGAERVLWWDSSVTYTQPVMRPINTGKPKPKPRPRMSLFETPAVSPLTKLEISFVDIGGVKDVGNPVIGMADLISGPKATLLSTDATLVTGNDGITPEGTAVTRDSTEENADVTCKDAGQWTSPDDRQL